MTTNDEPTGYERRRAIIAARRRHWQRTRRITGILLVLWLATTLVPLFFARELAGIAMFGWPLSFYLAAQGAALVYLAIVGAYAWRMRHIDRQFARELE